MKDALEFLNDVKVDLSEYMNEGLNDIEKQQIKNNVKKSLGKGKYHKGKKIAIALFAVMALVGIMNKSVISTTAETIATKIEKLFSKNPVKNFKNYEDTNAEQYTTVVEQKVTDNGLTITLNELIFDYKEILITYSITGENNPEHNLDANPKVFINGQEIKRRGISGSYSDKDKSLKIFTLEPRSDITEVGEFDVKVVFGGKDDFKQDKIIEEGKWEFKFKASNKAVVEATKEHNLNKEIKLSSGTIINIGRVITTPISTTIEYTAKDIAKGDFNKDSVPNFIIKDSNGNNLKSMGLSWRHNVEYNKALGMVRFRNVNENATSLNITPGIFGDNYNENSLYNKELKEHSFTIKTK